MELIYNFIKYDIYDKITPLNLKLFLEERNNRKCNLKKIVGLDEIDKIHIVYLSKMKNKNMRKYTNKIINKLFFSKIKYYEL